MKPARARPDTDAIIDAWLSSARLIIDSGATIATDTFLFGRGLSPSSRKTYYHVLKRFMDWAVANEIDSLADVTPRHVASHIEGLMPRTAKTRLTNPGKSKLLCRAVIATYFDVLLASDIVEANPAASYRSRGHSRQTTPTPALTPAELLRLLDVIPRETPLGKRNRALLGLLAGTSCRIAAALGLTRQALTSVQGVWRVTLMEKGQIPHTIPLTPAVWSLINPLLDLGHHVENGFIFPAWDMRRKRLTSKPMPYVEAYRTVQSIAVAAGITDKLVTPHSFRATAITALLDAGHDIVIAQRIAGHADPATTRRYDRREKTVKEEDVGHLEKALELDNV